jgi:hypothetical protein
MIWEIHIEDVVINRLKYRELEKLLDEELEAKRTEILRVLKTAKAQFGEVISSGDE